MGEQQLTPPGFRLLSVTMVTYNSADLVEGALRSAEHAAARAGIDVELVVVDNASSDGSADVVRRQFPAATVVQNTENVGFARGTNAAFAVARGDVWLLLNPDATLDPDALVLLLGFLASRPEVAAVAPAIDTPWAGGPEAAGMVPDIRSMVGHFLLLNRLLWRDRGGAWRGFMLQRRRHLGPRSVDWLGAAAMVVRPEAIRSIGGFDERFFLYGEDVDLGARLRAAGCELWLVPEARASHLVAASQGRVSTRWVDALHDDYAPRSRLLLAVVYDLILAAGLTGRSLVWRMLGRRGEGAVRSKIVLSSARRARRHAWWTLGEALGRRDGSDREEQRSPTLDL